MGLTGTGLLRKFWWIQPGFRLIIALSPLPETSTTRSTSDCLNYFTLYQTTPSPKLPSTPTSIPLPTPLPTSYPTSTPYSSFPFLPFPSLETGAYHVYQTVDPRDFPRTFKTHSHSLTRSSDQENTLESIPNHRTLSDSHRPSSTLINSRTSDSSEEN